MESKPNANPNCLKTINSTWFVSLIFSLCSNSSADPIKGNQQGTSISLPSFQGEKTPSSRTCHWMSPKFHEFAGKTALVYQKHSRVLEKASENKYDSQRSSPVKLARPEPALKHGCAHCL